MNKELYDMAIELLNARHCPDDEEDQYLWVSEQLYECKELLKLILLEEGCDEDE